MRIPKILRKMPFWGVLLCVATVVNSFTNFFERLAGWLSGAVFEDAGRAFQNLDAIWDGLPTISSEHLQTLIFIIGVLLIIANWWLPLARRIPPKIRQLRLYLLGDPRLEYTRYYCLAAVGFSVILGMLVMAAYQKSTTGALWWSLAAAVICFLSVFLCFIATQTDKIFSHVSPNRVMPIGYELGYPGQQIKSIGTIFEELREDYPRLESARQSLAVSHDYCDEVSWKFLHTTGEKRVESVLFNFRPELAPEIYRFIRDHLIRRFPTKELHWVGEKLYWNPAEGMRVVLHPSGYEVLADSGSFPISYDYLNELLSEERKEEEYPDFSSNMPGEKATAVEDVLTGEKVRWRDFPENLQVKYVDGTHEPDWEPTSAVHIAEVMGTLNFEDGKIILEDAVVLEDVIYAF